MPQQLGAKYMMAAQGGVDYEFAHKNHYEVDIQGLNSILVAQDCTLPRYEVEIGEVFHYNSRSKYAMRPNPSDMRVNFLDTINTTIFQALETWWEQVYDQDTDTMNYASAYKRQGNVMLYDPSGVLLRTWSVYGMIPKNNPVPEEAYSYTSGEVVQIAMVFSVDWATPNAASGAD